RGVKSPHKLAAGHAVRLAIAEAPAPASAGSDHPRPMMILVTHDVDEAIALTDRIMVMRSRPGRIFEEIAAELRRPRDRHSAAFDHVKARVLNALNRSLVGERVPDQVAIEHPGAGAAMW